MVETWFKVLLAALIPVIAAFFVPRSVRIYFIAAAFIILVLAIITLVRQERRLGSASKKGEGDGNHNSR